MATAPTATDRQALEQQLEALRERNRKLKAQIQLQTGKNKELQVTLHDAVVSTELEEEHITNGLLRRLDVMKRERDELSSQLKQEEAKKAQQETLLQRLKKNRKSLEIHLRQEEVEIKDRLERQLAHVQQQRRFMQDKVTAESTTLQHLHECVRSFRENPPAAISAVQNSSVTSSPGISPAKLNLSGMLPSDPAMMGEVSGSTRGHDEVTSDSTGFCMTEERVPFISSAPHGRSQSGGVDTLSFAAPGRSTPKGGALDSSSGINYGASVADLRVGASTPLSSAVQSSRTSNAAALPARDDAMLRLLETEIQVAEALRREASERVADYMNRVAALKSQITEAERDHEAQRASVDLMRAELHRTTSAVNELVANQEVNSEWVIDRELLVHTGNMRSSSVCSTLSSHTVETCASDRLDGLTPRLVLHGGRSSQQ